MSTIVGIKCEYNIYPSTVVGNFDIIQLSALLRLVLEALDVSVH